MCLLLYILIDWCNESKTKYAVIPMRSWGQLPLNYIEAWKTRKCDLVFTAERMGSRTISYCPDLGSSSSGGGGGGSDGNSTNTSTSTADRAKKTGMNTK